MKIDIHLIWYEPIKFQLRSKTLNWQRFRIIRVPSLKIFWGASRPMRSQYSELSTNEKPRFQSDFFCCPNLEFTNPMIISQLTDIWVQLEYQCNAMRNETWHSISANGMLIGSQSNAYWQPIKCQLTTNLKTINTKLKANWQPIECQSTTNLNQINNQSDTNRKPNWCQLKTNRMPIDIQSNANAELLPYRQAGVSSFCLSNPMPMQNCCHIDRQGYQVYAYPIQC